MKLTILFLTLFLPIQAQASDLLTFLKTNRCISCDLSFSDLNYSTFKDGDLSGSNLSYLNASRSSFFNYSFRAAKFYRANFSYARLISSDLTGVDFDNAIFFNTVVTNSVFNYKTVPNSIIINSIDFPIHLLSEERIDNLLKISSPDNHPHLYLSLLEQLNTLRPNDPLVSLLKAQFFFKHEIDFEKMIYALEDASAKFLAINQPEKASQIKNVLQSVQSQQRNKPSFEMPPSEGNGLGITAVNGIGSFFSNLLPNLINSTSGLLR